MKWLILLVLLAACTAVPTAIRAPLPRGEPMPVVLSSVDCTPLYTAPTVWLPETDCIPPGEMALVWRAGVGDALLPVSRGRFYAVNWRGQLGWVQLYRPSWADSSLR